MLKIFISIINKKLTMLLFYKSKNSSNYKQNYVEKKIYYKLVKVVYIKGAN